MRWLWPVLATGCNGFLGLDPTSPLELCTRHYADGDLDGDGVPNALDNCPALASVQSDSDGDRVGDACDPHPATSGDCVQIVESFGALSSCWEPSGWTPCGASWCSGGADQVTTLAYDVTGPVDYVELTGAILEPGTLADAMLQIVVGFDDTGGLTGTDCRAENQLGMLGVGTSTWDHGTETGSTDIQALPSTPFSTAPISLRWHANSAVTTCSLTSGIAVGDIAHAPVGGRLAIRAQHLKFRIDSLVAYASGGNCQ